MTGVTLQPHPATPCAAVTAITVDVEYKRNLLTLDYNVEGDVPALRVPDVVAADRGDAGRADDLWRHTCFEAFVRTPDRDAYYEFNFSPSSQWAFYRFETYRSGRSDEPHPLRPRMVIRRGAVLRLTTSVWLPEPLASGALLLGLSAVIEEAAGGISYWALRHPSAKPDFHHPDSFTLAIP